MDKEKLIQQMGESRTANHVLTWMDPVFKEVEKNLIDGLKGSFRAGTCNEIKLSCYAAQLCALEDLQVRIKGIAIRGDSAKEELERVGEQFGNGESGNE